jgi:RNA polymerase sigma-70 factor (ECF subfamily)
MHSLVSVSDHDLMDQTRAGDTDAFAALVDRHTGAVIGFLRRYLGDTHRSEDLAQEVFLRVYRAAPSYRPEARFTTWLYTIALNVARDKHKYDRRRPRLAFHDLSDRTTGERIAAKSPEADAARPDAEAARSELRAGVRAVIAEVAEPYRTALVLRDLQGLSYEETADVLDCPLGTVKSRVNRARLLFAAAYARTHGTPGDTASAADTPSEPELAQAQAR